MRLAAAECLIPIGRLAALPQAGSLDSFLSLALKVFELHSNSSQMDLHRIVSFKAYIPHAADSCWKIRWTRSGRRLPRLSRRVSCPPSRTIFLGLGCIE